MRLIRRCAGLALAVIAFELLLRWLGFGGGAVDAGDAGATREVTVRNRTEEGWADSRWTSAGVRVVPSPAPAGAPELLVLGDSFTQALQVGDAEVYTALLQERLGLPVLNRGCPACSPADYVAAAQRLNASRPGWTVIQLNPPDLYGDAFNSRQTHFEVRGRRLELVEVEAPLRSGFIEGARRSSAIVDRGIARAGMFRRASKMPPLFRASEESRVPEGAALRIPPSPHVEDVLDAMHSAWDGRVTFFFVPEYVEEADATWPYIDDRAADVERRFDAWCGASGASCVNLRAFFADFARRGRAPAGFPNSRFGRGHLNRDGHRAAAELIAEELEDVRRRGLF